MMNDFDNELTAQQAELLALLAEELGEAVQMVGKALRHGLESRNPISPGPTNRQAIESEIGHVWAAVRLLNDLGCISESAVDQSMSDKVRHVQRWLHHPTQNADTEGADRD